MLINFLNYYLFTSFRRQKINQELENIKPFIKGKILDIGGGREREKFKFPQKVKVIIADINKKFNPDVICSVEKLPFENNSFDLVKATELFEHVKNPEKGIKECIRVLKKRGYFILSMPFLSQIHADPFDFQRWTELKIRDVLSENLIKIKKFKIQGYYFSILADMIKRPALCLPFGIRHLLYLMILPLTYILLLLDKKVAQNSILLNKYHSGYFIVCQKN